MHAEHIAGVFAAESISVRVSVLGVPDKFVVFLFIMTITTGSPVVACTALQLGTPTVMLAT